MTSNDTPDLGEILAGTVREALTGRPVTVQPSLGDTVSVSAKEPKDATAAYYALIGAGFTVRDESRWSLVVTGFRS